MKISSDYALSLFNLAKEQSKIKDYEQALKEVLDVISAQPEWLTLVYSPALPLEERLALIDQAWSHLEVKEVLYFLKLLCEKGQIRGLKESIQEFFLLQKEWNKHVPVEVRFASALTEEQKARLEEKIRIMTGKIPEITYCEDSSLIGGIRVQIEDAVLDGSLSGKIGALKGVIKG